MTPNSSALSSLRRSVLRLFGGVLLCAYAGIAGAQSAPAVRVLVGFPPGGSADMIGRLMADRLRVVMNRNVIVENKPGAGGRLVVDLLKNAPADGSVVMIAPDTISATAPIVFKKLNYDPTRDYQPVSLLVQFPFAFAVGSEPRVSSFEEYVKWAKANPATATFGSPAAGSPPHFFGLLISKRIGVDMVHVPFLGTAPIVANLAGGQISAGISTAGDLMDHHRGGRIRMVAVSSERRMPQLPDVPTFAELGYPDFVSTGFYAMYVPANTPPAVVQQWNQAVHQVLAMPDLQERLRSMGLEPTASPPEEVNRLTSEGAAKWGPIIRASGFSVD